MWSPQQEIAIKKITAWFSDKNRKQVFTLHGYAGTGKSYLISEITNNIKGKVLFGTFTGKAAHVLKQKGVKNAQTIHSMIYKIKDPDSEKPEWVLNEDSIVNTCKLIVIDEVSMINQEMAEDLLSFGKPILVVGDPGQLPPVSGSGYFMSNKPDVMLTEIHRQAEDSPIIHLATHVRLGMDLFEGEFGSSRVISRQNFNKQMALDADQIIVGKNTTRHTFNSRIRQYKGYNTEYPVAGEKVICLKNNRIKGLLNGSMWTVESSSHNKSVTKMSVIDDMNEKMDVFVKNEYWSGRENELDFRTKMKFDEFAFGYSLSCHKAQGSSWNNVLIFDESDVFRENKYKWLYTSITRSSETVTIVI